MGWRIKTNNKNKWSLFSSVTDSDIATFKTQKELVNFIALEQICDGKKKAIETLMTFPHGWNVNEVKYIAENHQELNQEYYDWVMEISKFKTYEEYYKAVDDKLDELFGMRGEL